MVNHETQPDGPNSEGPNLQAPGLADTLFGVLFYPRATFARLAADPPPYGLAVAVFAVSVVVGAANSIRTLSMGALPLTPEGPVTPVGPIGPAGTVMLVLMSAIFAVLTWFGITGIRHLLAILLGGRGDVTVLFRLTPLAELPGVFMLPLGFIMAAVGPANPGGWNFILSLVLSLWTIILVYRAIRAAYGLSRGRALGVMFLPTLAIIAAFVLILTSASVWFLTDFMDILELVP